MKKVVLAMGLFAAVLMSTSCGKESVSETEKMYNEIDKGTPIPKNGIENGTPPPGNG